VGILFLLIKNIMLGEYDMKKTILVVDDDRMILNIARDLLESRYNIFTFDNVEDLLDEVEHALPDMILLDLVMPGMSGLEVMSFLKKSAKYKDVPVMFLTATQSAEIETECIQAGAEDFVTKPFVPAVLLSRVERILSLKEYQDNLEKMVKKQSREIVKGERELNKAQEKLLEQEREINRIQREVIDSMANLIESRDCCTGNHVKRTGIYVNRIAKMLQREGIYGKTLTDEYVDLLLKAAPMHDIGKIKIPDSILQKPGKLTVEEFDTMKTHAVQGGRIILDVLGGVESKEFIDMAMDIATFHHEKWDGSGYPKGLCGERIPLAARIMAVADVFDALVSRRCYKEAMSASEAFDILEESAGHHFDPKITYVVLKNREEFVAGIDLERGM
jgi:putative two-component system response regulator